MGSRNVSKVLGDKRLPALSFTAQVALIRMAQVAQDSGRDEPDVPRYWESHAMLAARMGLVGIDSDRSAEAATRSVRRAVAELVAAGLISRAGAERGCRQTYLLDVCTAVDR